MVDKFFLKKTNDIILERQESTDGEFIYEAEQALLGRWREGTDLEFLIDMLVSEITEKRLKGISFLGELGQGVAGLHDVIFKLVNDPLPQGRRAFVGYLVNSRLYNNEIREGLAACFLDFDLSVRAATINWAIFTTDDRLDGVAKLVEAGHGAIVSDIWRDSDLKRGLRGLSIVRSVRSGKSIQLIRESVYEEDSYIFDYLQFSERRIKAYNQFRER
ncbi:hypothetical protein [Pararhizobium gei]|uniref:hypothetical protein n=1 Tax=Pararhizobium gei TaxID=1395951 RepID=UPI0023DA233B|nr:hypothetical protein [Rhizobium gei]